MAANSKTTDLSSSLPKPESSNPDALKRVETTHNLLDLMEKNALAPVVNSLNDNVNTVANIFNDASAVVTLSINKGLKTEYKAPELPKLPDMEVGKVEEGSVGYYSQQILGTGASFLGYAIAGKIMGKALRTVGEGVPMGLSIGEFNVGSGIRAATQDARVANVLGATTYAGFKDTKEGETHFSNAVSTFASFAIFETGNSAINPASSSLLKLGQRGVIGYVGGAVQANVASFAVTSKWADATTTNAAGLSGAALNALLPGGRQALDRGLELTGRLPHTTEATARLHEAAAKALPKGQAPEPGSWADPNAVKTLNKAARVDLNTRVKLNDDGQTRIDQKNNVVFHQGGDDPLNVLQELAHRRIYKDPVYEQSFQSAAKEIKSPDPADPKNGEAREGYVNTRLEQEIAARTEQNSAAEKLGAARRVSVDRNEILTKEGYAAHFESEADAFIRSGGKDRPVIDYSGGKDSQASKIREALERDYDSSNPLDRPNVSGKDAREISEEYPRGRALQYFTYPSLRINGHDNVIFEARYDHDLNEVMLVKHDPETGGRSAVRLRNDGKSIENPIDQNGNILDAKSVEKFYFARQANEKQIPDNMLFDSNRGLRATTYEVTGGSELVPDKTKYTKYAVPTRYQMDGVDITPSASVEYPNKRVDFHQSEPFSNLITEWPAPIEDFGVRYKYSVPQTIPGSHRVFALDQHGQPTGGIADIFAPSHPLDTDFGQALRVDRDANSNDAFYHMKDGSAVTVFHHEGDMYHLHLKDDVETTKIYGPEDSYSERFSTPWESVFGLTNEVEVTPTKSVYHLANDDIAEKYKNPKTFRNIDGVDWSYQFTNGDARVQLNDEAKTRVFMPHDAIDTGIADVMATGQAELAPNSFPRYYLANGDAMDILPSTPVDGVQGWQGVVRKPGSLTFISGTQEDWKQVTFHFGEDKLPLVEEKSPYGPPTYTSLIPENCVDGNYNMKDIAPEPYPNGLRTKWGVAKSRSTYWTGESSLMMSDNRMVKFDAAGNQIEYFKNGQ